MIAGSTDIDALPGCRGRSSGASRDIELDTGPFDYHSGLAGTSFRTNNRNGAVDDT